LVILPAPIVEGSAIFFTKVVTQMVQFLSDSRAGDTLDVHVDLNDLNDEEEEGSEFVEVS